MLSFFTLLFKIGYTLKWNQIRAVQFSVQNVNFALLKHVYTIEYIEEFNLFLFKNNNNKLFIFLKEKWLNWLKCSK